MENIIKVKSILMHVDDPLESMLTVDYLQKLGIDYHFNVEIEAMLACLYKKIYADDNKQFVDDLSVVALSFSLLRQSGYPISSDVFNKFISKKGRFKSTLRTDVLGLLRLYEASYFNTGENVLDKANEFSSKYLRSCMENVKPNIKRLVRHSLKHPCNMTISSWWESTGLAEDLQFTRNQPLKWYLWSMTVLHDPQFSKCRIELTKVIAFVYIIDDIFDIYGSPDELSLFTAAINKWELSSIETLPTYMRSCYIALFNITNEIAQNIFQEQGWNPINSFKKSWSRLCNAFLLESRWLRSKQIPTADEYLRNAVTSSGVHTVLMHAFFLLGEGITKESVDFLDSNPPLLSLPATILRLWDDLGSAKDENQDGFDGSYVECYMKVNPQCSTCDVRDRVKKLIKIAWQNLNKECFSRGHFAPKLVTLCLNSARMVEVMYRYDDNQNLPIFEDYVNALLFKNM